MIKIYKSKFRIEAVLAVLLSFTVIATIIGTVNIFLGLKWNLLTLFIISIVSIYLAYKTRNLFYIDKKKNRQTLFGVAVILAIIYSLYSPVLEVRQDPAVYMLKSMNLINYGTTYAPTNDLDILINDGILQKSDYEGYAKILNGTKYQEKGLETDFYAGPAFINASIGLIDKGLSFYGVTLIAILVGVLMYYILIQHEFFDEHDKLAGILTIIFMGSPINTWFFRGTYSESISCLYFLLLIYLLTKMPKLNITNSIFIMAVALAAYCVRLDYIIIVLVVIFILTYSNIKYGLISTIIAFISHIIVKNTYNIYYSRISVNDFKVIQFASILLIIAFLAGVTFRQLKIKNILSVEMIIEHKMFKYLLVGLACVLIILSFRSSFVRDGNFEQVFMDGAMRQSYNEEIFNRFFMVFPSFIIILGVLSLPKFFLNKVFSTNSKIYVMAVFIPYCYYLYQSGNSPQLYFNMRRYIYIILPVIFLAFTYLMAKMDKKIAKLLVLGAAILMLHAQLESKQIIEFKGLDKSTQAFEKKYCTEDAIFLYDSELRYDFSSVVSYIKNECIQVDDLSLLKSIGETLKSKKIYYVSKDPINKVGEKFTVSYRRMGENFDDLPKDRQEKDLSMYVTPISSITDSESQANAIYPSKSISYTGFYEDGSWTNGNLNIYGNISRNESDKYLILKRCNYDNPLAKRNELKIHVLINNSEAILEKQSEDGQSFYFVIPQGIEQINNINIKTNTFTPKDEGINGDGRALGLDIESIKTCNEY